MNYVVLFVALLLPVTSRAEVALKSPMGLSVVHLLGSLLLVLACIFICALLMKKSNLIRQHNNQPLIKVVARQALTNKGQVQIIEVNQKRYLIAVTDQHINLLDTLPIPEAPLDEAPPQQTPATFASLLAKVSGKRNE